MPTSRAPTAGANGVTLTTTMSISPMRVRLELAQLLRYVAPGEDPRVDRRMERLDLAADERRHARQFRDGADFDAVPGEMLAGAVGGEDFHAEPEQVTGQSGDSVAVGDRQQGSHPGLDLPSPRSHALDVCGRV